MDPPVPGPGQAEASAATAALFFLDELGCWWRFHVPVGLQDSCSSHQKEPMDHNL